MSALPKKSVSYNLRVDVELRDAFVAAAAANDRTGANLIRDFMRQYVREDAPAPSKEAPSAEKAKK